LKNVIRGYTVVINEKIQKYYSVMYPDNDNGIIMNKYQHQPTKVNLSAEIVLDALINIELRMLTDPQFVDTHIQKLTNVIKKGDEKNSTVPTDVLMKLKQEKEVFEIYKRFDVISPNTSPIEQEQPLEKHIDERKTVLCPEGKEINPKTGRCINIKKTATTMKNVKIDKTLKTNTDKNVNKPCPEGKEINPKTGRCINIKKTVKNMKTDKNVKNPCPEGKEINPKTGRCINIKKTASTVKNIKNMDTTVKPAIPEKSEKPEKPEKPVKPAKTLRNINVDKNGRLKTCPPGKILNFKTGKCIKLTKEMAEILDKDF